MGIRFSVGAVRAPTARKQNHPLLRITRTKRIRGHRGCLGISCRRRTRYTAKSDLEAYTAATEVGVRMGKPDPVILDHAVRHGNRVN